MASLGKYSIMTSSGIDSAYFFCNIMIAKLVKLCTTLVCLIQKNIAVHCLSRTKKNDVLSWYLVNNNSLPMKQSSLFHDKLLGKFNGVTLVTMSRKSSNKESGSSRVSLPEYQLLVNTVS